MAWPGHRAARRGGAVRPSPAERRRTAAPLAAVVVLGVAPLLAACGGGSTPGAHAEVDGDWRLVSGSLDDTPLTLRDDYPVTLQLDGDEAAGTSGCNRYMATVTHTSDGVELTGIGGTEMACEEDVMALEAAYLDSLARVSQAVRDGGLTLSGDGVELVYAEVPPVDVAPIVGTDWLLVSLVEGDTVSSPLAGAERATLRLGADGSLAATTGCRTMTGTWEERAGEIVLTDATADGDCAPSIARQDALVVAVLGDGFDAVVDDHGTLQLRSSGGLGLDYSNAVPLPTSPPQDEVSTPSPAATS